MANTVPLNAVPDPSVIVIRAKRFWLPDGRQVVMPATKGGERSRFTSAEARHKPQSQSRQAIAARERRKVDV
jgi:hypothetical protein